MSHCLILMIGKIENLDKIYADCQDSSSETDAEMTFGYDYCSPYNILSNKSAITIENEDKCMFTKNSKIFTDYVLNGYFYDVWDIRKNDCDHLIFNGCIRKNREEALENTYTFLKNLPDDTTFFYCEARL